MKDKEESKKQQHDMVTEPPFSGEYWNNNEKGEYKCKSCGQVLFTSDTKLDSSIGPIGLRGWPAFDTAIPGSVEYKEDSSLGMTRVEVVCSKCKAHLGHVFDDETPTNKHYCINSCFLDFDKND